MDLDCNVTHLHSTVDVVKQLRTEVARLGREVEKMTHSFTNPANIPFEAIKRAENLIASLAASFCRADA